MRGDRKVPVRQTAPVLLSMLACTLVHGQTTRQADPAEQLAQRWESRLLASRYMERGEGRPVVVPGWEGFDTKRYTYSVKDKDGTTKTADVIMLNPSAGQIATWIVQAITEAKGSYTDEAGDRFFRHVIGQSGGQFPVAGIVFEDILPADGAYEIFCFRDGVTVAVEGVTHRGTTQPTPQEIEASISGKVTRVYRYARVCSTSPEMALAWKASAGNAADAAPDDVISDSKPTAAWQHYIRQSYQQAWRSARNVLFVAWAKAQP